MEGENDKRRAHDIALHTPTAGVGGNTAFELNLIMRKRKKSWRGYLRKDDILFRTQHSYFCVLALMYDNKMYEIVTHRAQLNSQTDIIKF